ncbi:MAG: hypothetical protein M1830_003415 [Pleopsidium flavum]|nr:MAG: hypothetical protein M1830_003415 [Pleopsidium flavum]
MVRQSPQNPLIAIIGATGTGKSKLAVELALRFNGEIINGDAMQMYQGLPIITNKITTEERKGVPHHLLGCVGLEDEAWRVGVFRSKALGIIEEIRSRGNVPILVGGTHYYTQALLFNDAVIDDDNGVDHEKGLTSIELREKWPILEGSTEDMLAVLEEVDPLMAERWHPNDRRKIRRSLEIWLQRGRKASDIYLEQQTRRLGDAIPADERLRDFDTDLVEAEVSERQEQPQGRFQALVLWTHASPDVLKACLDTRVDDMLRNGLLSEVDSMEQFYSQQVSNGHPIDKTRGIWVSIGYKEFEEYNKALLSGGTEDKILHLMKLEATEQTKAATRQYAKRQVRWIRIKLVHAVKDAGMIENMFLLDGSDLTRWSEDVEHPAISLSEKFLEGGDLPNPESLSRAAQEILAPKRDFDMSKRRDLWVKKTCDVCATTVVSEDDWARHMKSRRHRRAVKSNIKKLASSMKVESTEGDTYDEQDSPI